MNDAKIAASMKDDPWDGSSDWDQTPASSTNADMTGMGRNRIAEPESVSATLTASARPPFPLQERRALLLFPVSRRGQGEGALRTANQRGGARAWVALRRARSGELHGRMGAGCQHLAMTTAGGEGGWTLACAIAWQMAQSWPSSQSSWLQAATSRFNLPDSGAASTSW
jgi:hypothetical protein